MRHEGLGPGADGDAHVERLLGLVDQPHPREVGAEQLARALDDQLQRRVDVGLGGLDLHADLDERLVGGGPARLHLDLLDEQREMRGEHGHQRPRLAGPDAAAAQVGDERAADRRRRGSRTGSTRWRSERAGAARARPPASSARAPPPAPSLMPCVAITVDARRRAARPRRSSRARNTVRAASSADAVSAT